VSIFGRLKALMVAHVILLGPKKLGLGCPRGYKREDWKDLEFA
jgi:hypothetical protein